MKAKDHSKKFKRWQEKVSQETRFLSEQVDKKIISFFEQNGFQKVEVALNNTEWPVSMNEIRLERIVGNVIDSICVGFAKHGTAKFQIRISRRELNSPHEFIRDSCLVKKSNQRYFLWGKPWWHPLIFWGESRSIKTVDEIMPLLPQILEFLESGTRGKNISMEF